MAQPIRVWRFADAPEKYRKLSEDGGDEDWLAVVPKALSEVPPWMGEGTSFGCCSVSERKLPNGDILVIGAHA